MCRPDHFGIEYEINPWMHVAVQVDHALAASQWDALYRTYIDLGVQVELAAPVAGLPDMVFTANAAVLWDDRAVLSNFHHAERQGEEKHWRQELERLNFEVHELPRSLSFEGAGDALFVGDRLFCGYGFRTDRDSPPPRGADPRGRGCVPRTGRPALLSPGYLLLSPRRHQRAGGARGLQLRHRCERFASLVPNLIEVPVEVAAGFACNAMPLGRHVLASLTISQMEAPLRAAGYTAIPLAMGEFLKAGGGVRCLSLPLGNGDRAAAGDGSEHSG